MSTHTVLRDQRKKLRAAFVSWLGSINARRSSTNWWAFATSSKNLLSSPLGSQVVSLVAERIAVQKTDPPIAAFPGQSRLGPMTRLSVRRTYRQQGFVRSESMIHELFALTALRLLWQFAKVFISWLVYARHARTEHGTDVIIFTYADRNFSADRDSYFGQLAESLSRLPDYPTTMHLAYVQSGYRRFCKAVASTSGAKYVPLFSELRLIDIGVAIFQALRELNSIISPRTVPRLNGTDLSLMVRKSMLWDIGKGGYFHNLLAYRSFARLARCAPPKKLIYPYENKPLEKMLLLALRRHAPCCRLIGYQHTSLTNRHTSLIFASGEAERTPLPDRIVTTGSLSRRWLETNGRYPDNIFQTGFSLRQAFPPLLSRRLDSDFSHARILFVPSSSLSELLNISLWLLEVHAIEPTWKLAIRTHPEFPLPLLDKRAIDAIGACARDLSGTNLQDNLAWCDAVAYVSSTVALEALIVGRPVVHLETDEFFSSDPTLGAVPLRWNALSPAALVQTIKDSAFMQRKTFEKCQQSARAFVGSYLHQPQLICAPEIFS